MSEDFNFSSLLGEKKEEKTPEISIEITPEIKKDKKPKSLRKAPLHKLNEKNLIRFIKEQENTKPYEMKIRFYDSSSFEIQKLLDKLFQENIIKRNKNGWISLK